MAGPTVGVAETVNDVTGLNPIDVTRVVRVTSEEKVRRALRYADERELPVSMAGARHSQGGHTGARDGLVLDMSAYDRVLAVDAERRVVRVQAGATWADVQAAVNPLGLAVAVMQSSNIFTVGGSIAVNAHGRDPRYGPVLDTVTEIRVMLASGEVVEVSRRRQPKLFEAMVGSYGLIGVILEAELRLVDNATLEKRVESVDYRDYPDYLRDRIVGRDDVELHFGRLSIAPGDDFLRDGYVVDHVRVGPGPESPPELKPEAHRFRNRLVFDLSRASDLGKSVRWELQQRVVDPVGERSVATRNEAMRPPVRFLERDSDEDADVLQEYFVPLERFEPFIDAMRTILAEHDVNLLNVTLRYLPGFEATALPYATRNSVAVVLYLNVRADARSLAEARLWTRALIQAVLDNGGNYYLPYLGFAARGQFQRAYPDADRLLELKDTFDPEHRFQNRFYRQYLRPADAGG